MVGRDTFWQQKFGKRLRFLALCSVYVKQIAYGIMQYNKNDTTPSSPGHRHQKKLTTVFRVVKPAVGGVKLSPFLTEFPPFPFPLLQCNKESTESPVGRGHSRSRSARAFSYCVTRFRGGALRHAKFPKTSYKVQLLDTHLHGR